jgi:hypothetical protein
MDSETTTPEGSYFDASLGMVVTEAGKAKWRARLAEARGQRDTAANASLRAKLRLGPAATA